MRSQASSTRPEIAIATVSASTQVITRSGWREASSSTVAIAEGPASSGTASGKMKGSRPSGVPYTPPSAPKIMRIATISRITPPATSSERSDRCITRRNASPPNMKPSSTAKAMLASRSATRRRRSFGTLFMIGM